MSFIDMPNGELRQTVCDKAHEAWAADRKLELCNAVLSVLFREETPEVVLQDIIWALDGSK